jgi:hypothetical protein
MLDRAGACWTPRDALVLDSATATHEYLNAVKK